MRLHMIAIALLAITSPTAAQTKPLSGTFTSDRAGMEQQATITSSKKGDYRVKLSVSAERCVGKLEATGRMRGDALVTDRPKKDDACRITIRKTTAGISVDEDKCLSWHGAACEFSGPYIKK